MPVVTFYRMYYIAFCCNLTRGKLIVLLLLSLFQINHQVNSLFLCPFPSRWYSAHRILVFYNNFRGYMILKCSDPLFCSVGTIRFCRTADIILWIMLFKGRLRLTCVKEKLICVSIILLCWLLAFSKDKKINYIYNT